MVDPSILYPGAALLLLGLAISSLGAYSNLSQLNPDEVVGPGLFWISVALFTAAFLLRGAFSAFLHTVRRPVGAAIFAAYLAVHLLLYGFVLDALFSIVYGSAALSQTFGLLVTTNVFLPPSALSLFFDLLYDPVISFSFPPVFGTALTFYSIAIAFIIAALILANMGRIGELGEPGSSGRRARAYVILPTIGVVLGASCCLSVAGIVALVFPAAAALSSATWVYYVTYLFFPALAIVLLYANLRSVERMLASRGDR
jgi:hypothetical protein